MGFVLGGIGLANYLRSFTDFVIPVLLGVVRSQVVGDTRSGRTQPADNQAAAAAR
jgi:hypothetical protein